MVHAQIKEHVMMQQEPVFVSKGLKDSRAHVKVTSFISRPKKFNIKKENTFWFLQINLVLVVHSLVITMVNVITQLVNAFAMKVIKALIALVTQNTVKLLVKTYDFSAPMLQSPEAGWHNDYYSFRFSPKMSKPNKLQSYTIRANWHLTIW